MRAKHPTGLVFFPAFDWAISPTHPEREERLLYTQDQLKEEGIFEIDGLREWSRQSGDIKVRGAKRRGAHGAVELGNRVSLAREGGRIVYRESIQWRGLKEAILRIQAGHFRDEMDEAYPFLGRRELKRLANLAEDRLLEHLDLFIEADKDDPRVTAGLREFGEAAADILREARPGLDLDALDPAVENLLLDESGHLERSLYENYPGAALSFMGSVDLSVTMPSEILGGNAETVNGRTARWSVELSEAILRPVEFTAECRTD